MALHKIDGHRREERYKAFDFFDLHWKRDRDCDNDFSHYNNRIGSINVIGKVSVIGNNEAATGLSAEEMEAGITGFLIAVNNNANGVATALNNMYKANPAGLTKKWTGLGGNMQDLLSAIQIGYKKPSLLPGKEMKVSGPLGAILSTVAGTVANVLIPGSGAVVSNVVGNLTGASSPTPSAPPPPPPPPPAATSLPPPGYIMPSVPYYPPQPIPVQSTPQPPRGPLIENKTSEFPWVPVMLIGGGVILGGVVLFWALD